MMCGVRENVKVKSQKMLTTGHIYMYEPTKLFDPQTVYPI